MTYRPKWRSAQDTNVTTTPAAFASNSCIAVVIQADPDNTGDVFLGDSSAQYIQLLPGASISLNCRDLSELWRKSSAGTQTVNFLVAS